MARTVGVLPSYQVAPQLLTSAALGTTGLMIVPPKRATSGAPYCASIPKSLVVTPGLTLPKFHTQPPDCGWLASDQNG